MNSNKIIGIVLILTAIVGYALAIYQYSINRGKIPTILFSTLILGYGISIVKRKK
jgi:hypothetical protein